jgi:hypothetical protein
MCAYMDSMNSRLSGSAVRAVLRDSPGILGSFAESCFASSRGFSLGRWIGTKRGCIRSLSVNELSILYHHPAFRQRICVEERGRKMGAAIRGAP